MREPFALQKYAEELRDRTAWAGDVAIEGAEGEAVSREALYRIGQLWALALLDDRFEDLLLPVLVTELPVLEQLDRESGERGWGLTRGWFEERLRSRACLLLFDGVPAEEWPGNARFRFDAEGAHRPGGSMEPGRGAVMEDERAPQINVSKIPGGGGVAGALFAVISMVIFLIGIPALRWFLPGAVVLGGAVAVGIHLAHRRPARLASLK